MLVSQKPQFEVESTVTGKVSVMQMDTDATHLMSMFIDMYKDPEAAIVREISTNALDAQIENGYSGPIEVILPSRLAPTLTIKDFGVGMNAETIDQVYSRYGASTKRNSNSQHGKFGIGCKSPLTYTNQFTVVSVKDGVSTIVLVTRDVNGAGSMTVVSELPTNEPSGTEVQIPCKPLNEFDRKARHFFSFWKPGTVLINGKPPERFKGLPVGKSAFILENERQSYVVMGNVAYPADINHGLGYSTAVVFYVEIGEVDIPPARDSLMMTEETQATLKKCESQFRTDLADAIQIEIEKSSSHSEAIKILSKWRSKLPSQVVNQRPYSYKGDRIPSFYENGEELIMVDYHKGYSRSMSAHERTKQIGMHAVPNIIWVYGYDRSSFTAGQRKKFDKYASEHTFDNTPARWVMCSKRPTSPFIDQKYVISWKDDIEPIKIPRNASTTASGRIPGSYDFYEGTTYREGVSDDEIDDSYPVYYFRGRWHEATEYATVLATRSPDFTLVILSENRMAKFQRNFPKATNARDEVKSIYRTWTAKLPMDTRKALVAQQSGYASFYSRLDESKVDDPDVKELLRLTKIDLTQVNREQRAFRNVTGAAVDNLPDIPNPMVAYPLVSRDQYSALRFPEHMYIYMNAVYAAKKSGTLAA